ncbi:hypothetical protein T492DRAFT_843283 [Pavlovales sp. CCMP2436]|nr:hypothetical protein T492DRAFT_843283 [Pavlovales sp. CCMP2436]
MSAPVNLWQQLWLATLPLPAARQRPLLHAPREAEIVLHWLETLTPTAALHQVLPALLVAAARELAGLPCARAAAAVGEAAARVAAAAAEVDGVTAGGTDAALTAAGERAWEGACAALARAEAAAALAHSLARKLPPLMATSSRALSALARGETVALDDEAERRAIAHFACAGAAGGAPPAGGQLELPAPDVREYVLTALGCRSAVPAERRPPAVGSRMYVGVRDEQFRVAIAMSHAAP